MAQKSNLGRVAVVQEAVMAPVNSPASNSLRGDRVRDALSHVSDAMERQVDADVVNYFVPQIQSLIDRDAAWFIRMAGHVLAGGGISQSTYARMVVVLVRMPQWPTMHWWPSIFRDYDMPSSQAVICRRSAGNSVHFYKCWLKRPSKGSVYLRTPFDKGDFPKRYVLLPRQIDDGQIVLSAREVA